MKKLFGMMILATLPVACGTTNPNAPELPATDAAAGDATFEASGRGGRLAPAACTTVARVEIVNVERRPGSAIVSAQPFGASTPSGGAPAVFCGRPTWSVTPEGRGVRLTTGLSSDAGRENATLEAPAGTYEVTVSYTSLTADVSATTTVTFR
jgi:hypothetical protein